MRTVVLGVTGSIAAYKAAEVVSRLRKLGLCVKVVMTQSAARFVSPLTFETLTGQPVAADMFERSASWDVEHVSLAKEADAFLIAPATANIIAKLAHGIADDMLSTVAMAMRCKTLIAPAMNDAMYLSAANAANIALLKERGAEFIGPRVGVLACGDEAIGALAGVDAIVEVVCAALTPKTMEGCRVLVSAGPTKEHIDPVRYISNRSSGKMGYAIAREARRRGASVTLVHGATQLLPVEGARMIEVTSTRQMLDAMLTEFGECDICIKAAAPADFMPTSFFPAKIKKDKQPGATLELVNTPDILTELAARKKHQYLVGFAAETNDVEEYALEKLQRKKLDMIVANDVSKAGRGFDSDTNEVMIYYGGKAKHIALCSKDEVASSLLTTIMERLSK